MISASQLAHAYVGRPAVEGCAAHEAEPCAVCGGESTRGKPVWEFIGSSLTDQTSFCSPHSDHVCEACVYVRARFSPVVGREPKPCDRCNGTGVEPSQAQARKGNRGHREPGQPCAKCDGTCRKESAGRWSNFTHLYDGHTLDNATKGEKPKILAFLRRMATSSPLEPCTWFAAISDTGQKHVLPYTPINMRRGSGHFMEWVEENPDANLHIQMEHAEKAQRAHERKERMEMLCQQRCPSCYSRSYGDEEVPF